MKPDRAKKTQIVKIADCAEVMSGFSFAGALKDDPYGTLQVITARHIGEGDKYEYKESDRFRITPEREIDEKYFLKSGDILFMSKGAKNQAVMIASVPQPSIAPSSFFILRVGRIAPVDPGYLLWAINQQPIRNSVNELRTGAGTPMIPRRGFGAIEIPLPDLETQRKIAKLCDLQDREAALLRDLVEKTEKLRRNVGQRIFENIGKRV